MFKMYCKYFKNVLRKFTNDSRTNVSNSTEFKSICPNSKNGLCARQRFVHLLRAKLIAHGGVHIQQQNAIQQIISYHS